MQRALATKAHANVKEKNGHLRRVEILTKNLRFSKIAIRKGVANISLKKNMGKKHCGQISDKVEIMRKRCGSFALFKHSRWNAKDCVTKVVETHTEILEIYAC